jgi:hypothetical protein
MHLAENPRNPLKSRNIYPGNDEVGDLCSAKCNRETEGRSDHPEKTNIAAIGRGASRYRANGLWQD